MQRKRNRMIGLLVCAYVVIAAGLCGCVDEGQEASARARSEANARARARSKAQEEARMKDTMIRRVNGIVTTIANVEQRLSDHKSCVEADKEAFESARLKAQRSYQSGQMGDFRVWQKIGREKQQNIAATAQKVERTLVALRSDAESQLRTVRWSSGQDESKYRQSVEQRMNKLEGGMSDFSEVSKRLSDQKWLNYSE